MGVVREKRMSTTLALPCVLKGDTVVAQFHAITYALKGDMVMQ